jgi:hypothetical protein
MNTALSTRSPLFCDIALAERIERADAELIALASRASQRRTSTPGFVLPIAGGVASFAEPGSPLNKVAGLGFAGVPAPGSSRTSSAPTPPAAPPPRSSSPTSSTRTSPPC